MTYSQFEASLLVACYLVAEDQAQEIIPVRDAITKYGLEPRPNWVTRAIEGFLSNGFAKDMRTLGNDVDQDVWLTAAGVRQAEQWIENKVVEIEAIDEIKAQPDREERGSTSIDSSTWTGLPVGFVLSEDRRREIVRALDGAEEVLPRSAANQHDQAQARAYIVSARALLEAPEPEPELAWELVGRANHLAGIASLLIAVIALFKS